MVRIRRFVVVCLAAWAVAPVAFGQSSYPMILSVKPVAVQAGQTAELTVQSRYSLFGASQVLFADAGVTAELPPASGEEDKAKPLQALKVKFTAAADALPGVRDFRLATPQGPSTLGQLVVVREPVVVESGKNDSPAEANPIMVPAAVCGTLEKAEDVDYFRFSASAGTSLAFHVRSMRLQDRIHDLQAHVDPILTLRSSTGQTIAASDNYFYGDPFLSHRFDQAGEYLLEIRDVRFQGNASWEYVIEITDRPFVTGVYPPSVSRGETKVELIGRNLPPDAASTLVVPADAPLGLRSFRWPLAGDVTNPAAVVVTDLPRVLETDDNDAPAKATPVTLPAGLNGRLEREGDVDCFAFEAKKGERFSFEVIARRLQSALDSEIRLLDAAGKQVGYADDLTRGKRSSADSWLENWTVPADGKYVLEIRDLHLRGGPDFPYFVQITRSAPYFELYVDTDKTPLFPGTSNAIFVRVVRKNGFTGEVQLAIDGLPAGVRADCGSILGGKAVDGCIVLHTAADAAPAATNVHISGSAMHTEGDATTMLSATATSYQETYQPGGGRGHWPAEMHTVAVGRACDLVAVKLSETDIRLKPGESKRIDVTLERAAGFDKNVTLDVVYQHLASVFGSSLPEGITLERGASKTLLTGKDSQGHITLKAAANAPAVKEQLVPVMAHIAINFVMKTTFAAGPLKLSIEAP